MRHSLKAREQVQRPWGGRVCYVRVVTGGEVRRQIEQGQEQEEMKLAFGRARGL